MRPPLSNLAPAGHRASHPAPGVPAVYVFAFLHHPLLQPIQDCIAIPLPTLHIWALSPSPAGESTYPSLHHLSFYDHLLPHFLALSTTELLPRYLLGQRHQYHSLEMQILQTRWTGSSGGLAQHPQLSKPPEDSQGLRLGTPVSSTSSLQLPRCSF